MTSKNLARRLERLEAEIMPGEEKIVVLRIQGVTPDRQVVSNFELRVPIGPPMGPRPPKQRWRCKPANRLCRPP